MTVFITPTFAGTYSANDAINDAIQNSGFYQSKNINGAAIQYVTTTGLSQITSGGGYCFGFLTYGQPYGDQGNGQYRYIGNTFYGEDYTNMDFPADKNANGVDFASMNWVRQPWGDSSSAKAIKASNSKFRRFPGDGSPEYHTAILVGIMVYGATNANNGYTIGETKDSSFYGNIEQYVHILAPPTQYAWGIGRMWHMENGRLWYVTIPIMPNALLPTDPDLSTNLETGTFSGVQPGRKITSTVAYKLNPDHPRPERAGLRLHHVVDGQEFPVRLAPVNGAPLPEKDGYITLNPGDTKVYQYTFTVQSTKSKILSRINPVETDRDRNWDDNRAEAAVIPQSYDIKVEIAPDETVYTTINGELTDITYRVAVTRKDDIAGSIDVTGTLTQKTGSDSFILNLSPGETKEISNSFSAGPGTYTIEAEAWPAAAGDVYPPDNRDRVTVSVVNREFNPETGIHSETLR